MAANLDSAWSELQIKQKKKMKKRDFMSSTCAMKVRSKYFGKEKGGAQSYERAFVGKHRLCDEMFDQMFV